MTSSKPARTRPWRSGDATVPRISEAIASACPKLFLQSDVYSSEDMKTGIDQTGLCHWAETLLGPLFDLDMRGGFFAQSDMFEAVRSQAELEANKAHVEKLAIGRKLSVLGFFYMHIMEDFFDVQSGNA